MTDKTVLIADDEPALLQLLTLRCGQELGLRVKTATDGLQALMLAASEMPDLIILDVNMPGTDGLSVCEKLAADPKLCNLPVVVLTSRSDEDAIRRCEAVGAQYCHKGLEIWHDLDAVVRQLLGLEPTVPEPAADAPPSLVLPEIASPAAPEPKGEPTPPPTALVVDEDPEFTKAISLRLDGLGIQVFRAENGKIAMMIAEKERPDVIISEYKMSDRAAEEFLTELKRNHRTRNIPIILLAVASVDERQRRALGRQMSDRSGSLTILSKPIDFGTLLSELLEYIELPDPDSERAVAFYR